MKNYRYAQKLNKKDSATDIRHIPIVGGGAPVIALLGGDKDQQVEANWDAWKLRGGTLAGALLGSIVGGYAGHALKGPQATTTGAALGALGGFGLGNYLTFKAMAKNRGVDDTYSLRHIPIIGKGAKLSALQGYSPEDQVESNWNDWKIDTPNLLVMSGAGALGIPYPYVLGQGAGLYTYSKLKDNKLNEE